MLSTLWKNHKFKLTVTAAIGAIGTGIYYGSDMLASQAEKYVMKQLAQQQELAAGNSR
jgi:hypothetical protein